MRTIKFRAKRIDNGKWLYGDLMHDNIGGSYIYPIETENLYKENAVFPDTVSQFTGLRDKKGKEIYEGDIIIEKIKSSSQDGDRLVICFEDFEWEGKNSNGSTTSLSLLATYHTIEVIGNIHDNPELLKGGNHDDD